MKDLTPEELEIAARKLCELRGRNPDAISAADKDQYWKLQEELLKDYLAEQKIERHFLAAINFARGQGKTSPTKAELHEDGTIKIYIVNGDSKEYVGYLDAQGSFTPAQLQAIVNKLNAE